jgi:hypothetical protein
MASPNKKQQVQLSIHTPNLRDDAGADLQGGALDPFALVPHLPKNQNEKETDL